MVSNGKILGTVPCQACCDQDFATSHILRKASDSGGSTAGTDNHALGVERWRE